MHTLLGILATIVTISFLFSQLANANFNGLNPFLWHRRRKWRKALEPNPIYTLDQPMDVTALFMLAIAKADGEISSQKKQALLSLFENEFDLSRKEATVLLASSSYLLGNGQEFRKNPKKVLSKSRFTEEQIESAQSILEKVTQIEGKASQEQTKLIEAFWMAFSVSQWQIKSAQNATDAPVA